MLTLLRFKTFYKTFGLNPIPRNMATTVLRVNLQDINLQFFKDLQASAGSTAEVEIRVETNQQGEGLFSEEQFWDIIDLLDWNKGRRDEIIQPAIQALSKLPISNIYLFAEKLAEKLYRLDTRQHGKAYLAKQEDDYFSMDDFLYVRCGVVAEGRAYYEQVLKDPSTMPAEIDFEHLLSVAPDAYALKTGREFNYVPSFSYETRSNAEAWL